MEKRYQIRVGTHKVDFRYDADTQTWRARRPGTQDYTTGQAGTLEAARDAVRRYIQDEEPAGESLHPRAGPDGAGTFRQGPSRYRHQAKVPDSATGHGKRPQAKGPGKESFPAERRQSPPKRKAGRLRVNHHIRAH
jgi:hypothetical protein